MTTLREIYGTSLSLLTDLYQITMVYGYWKQRIAQREAVFHLFFRNHPFGGGFTVAAGLEQVVDFVGNLRFDESDVAYLGTLTGNDGRPLFEPGFLDYLREMRLTVDVDAVPEGTVVFPHQPLLRVTGPLAECQLLETPLLNLVNFQTLIATKAARVCNAAGNEPVLEFGLRRAQGIDGSLAASRAAYLGGCAATSNVLAGKLLGIPVRGTHAHSWVMSFDDELTAFEQYAEAMPNNGVFLVDTYDTLEGVKNAVRVGCRLREQGHKMVGIRLDSGDLAYLSIEARKLLDEAGLTDAVIVASNDLDERLIESLHSQGAKISVWGIGTKLVTAYGQPALGGVYKLGAIRSAEGRWLPKVKLSEQAIKTSIPGVLQVRRYAKKGRTVADMIFSELLPPPERPTIVDPADPARRIQPSEADSFDDLLVPAIRAGRPVYESPPLSTIRDRTRQQLSSFHPTVLRIDNPHTYPVGLEEHLHDQRIDLMRHQRGVKEV
ncbi:MAG: nicotinate phosphoribosyltransferase [Planctomycetia bacterium]|jgi:nicotinate phosphoribosyltransferase